MEEGSPGVESCLYLGVSLCCCRIVHGHIFSGSVVKKKRSQTLSQESFGQISLIATDSVPSPL